LQLFLKIENVLTNDAAEFLSSLKKELEDRLAGRFGPVRKVEEKSRHVFQTFFAAGLGCQNLKNYCKIVLVHAN
jgi:hypothetical protein